MAAAPEAASVIIEKLVEKATILKSQPQVLVQGMSPPVIGTIARAIVSESIRKSHFEVSIPTVTGLAAGPLTLDMEHIPEDPLGKGLSQEQVPFTEKILNQDHIISLLRRLKKLLLKIFQILGFTRLLKLTFLSNMLIFLS